MRALHVDGYFGLRTEQAVRWLQARTPLTGSAIAVDGIVGAQTWERLFA